MIEIKRFPTGDVLLRIQADTLRGAALHGANLRGADLSALDLTGADLGEAAMRGADLCEATLDRANLQGASLLLVNMRRASLREANLQGAMMEGAALTNADLRGADLTSANLFGAPMHGALYDERTKWPAGVDAAKAGARLVAGDTPPPADAATEKAPCPHCGHEVFKDAKKCRHCGRWLNKPLFHDTSGMKILDGGGQVKAKLNSDTLQGVALGKSDLRGANLINANFRGAQLKGSDLARAQLMGANLENAMLAEANLSGANLREANLAGAELQGALLKGTSLEKAILNGADLSKSNLREANLADADVRGADFFGANLDGANLQGIEYDGLTYWPAGFDPIAHGAPQPPHPLPISPKAAAGVPEPAAAGPPVRRASAPEQIQCPYCAETILADAKKCRFCGEWLGEAAAAEVVAMPPAISGWTIGAVAVAVGALAALITLFVLMPNFSSKPAPRAGYAISFPETSIGDLTVRAWGSNEVLDWQALGEARGNVTIPQGKELRLTVNAATSDLSALRGLAPGDLHTLDLIYAPIADEQLANLAGLTGLKELYLPHSIEDPGMIHLKPLVALTTLILGDTNITDVGVEPLESIQSLEYVMLPKSVSDMAIERLGRALPKCTVQRLDARPAAEQPAAEGR